MLILNLVLEENVLILPDSSRVMNRRAQKIKHPNWSGTAICVQLSQPANCADLFSASNI